MVQTVWICIQSYILNELLRISKELGCLLKKQARCSMTLLGWKNVKFGEIEANEFLLMKAIIFHVGNDNLRIWGCLYQEQRIWCGDGRRYLSLLQIMVQEWFFLLPWSICNNLLWISKKWIDLLQMQARWVLRRFGRKCQSTIFEPLLLEMMIICCVECNEQIASQFGQGITKMRMFDFRAKHEMAIFDAEASKTAVKWCRKWFGEKAKRIGWRGA